jgi:carboxypeptidase D
VDGKKIPDVDFDVGESYAGLMPITPGASNSSNQLYFWYFPTPNPAGKGDLTIWLNVLMIRFLRVFTKLTIV